MQTRYEVKIQTHDIENEFKSSYAREKPCMRNLIHGTNYFIYFLIYLIRCSSSPSIFVV